MKNQTVRIDRDAMVVSHGVAPKFPPRDSTVVRNLIIAEREAMRDGNEEEAKLCRRRLRDHDRRRDDTQRRLRSVTSIGAARLLRDHRFGQAAAVCKWFQAGQLSERHLLTIIDLRNYYLRSGGSKSPSDFNRVRAGGGDMALSVDANLRMERALNAFRACLPDEAAFRVLHDGVILSGISIDAASIRYGGRKQETRLQLPRLMRRCLDAAERYTGAG